MTAGLDKRDEGSLEVCLLGTLACEQESLLREFLTTSPRLTPVPDDADDALRRSALARADAMITLHYDPSMPPAPRLRLLQVGGAGYDGIALAALPSGTVVCNAFGHENAIAEYCLLTMLLWGRRFLDVERSFRAGSWQMSGRLGGPYQEELAGKTVGVIGLGRIGQAVADRARALDARVVAVNRTPRVVPGFAWVAGLDALPRLLEESDFVVICLALAPETEGLIDARALGRMRPGAFLINVARGTIVEEDALYAALRDRTIAGAAIDAWYQYGTREDLQVQPSRHPFHTLDNVLMTPHASAWTTAMIRRRWSTIAANLDRLATGHPLDNVVYVAP